MSDDDLSSEQGIAQLPSLLHSPTDCRREPFRAFLDLLHNAVDFRTGGVTGRVFFDSPSFNSFLLELVILSPVGRQ